MTMENLDTSGSYTRASKCAGCSTDTIHRWERRIMQYRTAGNREHEQLADADQLLLSICIYVYPEIWSDQITAFVHSNGGDIYSQPQMTDRCRKLDLTRKRASKESCDAFSPSSIRSLIWYKTLPPPLGVHTQPVYFLIDVHETGFYLKKCSSNYGRENHTCRV